MEMLLQARPVHGAMLVALLVGGACTPPPALALEADARIDYCIGGLLNCTNQTEHDDDVDRDGSVFAELPNVPVAPDLPGVARANASAGIFALVTEIITDNYLEYDPDSLIDGRARVTISSSDNIQFQSAALAPNETANLTFSAPVYGEVNAVSDPGLEPSFGPANATGSLHLEILLTNAASATIADLFYDRGCDSFNGVNIGLSCGGSDRTLQAEFQAKSGDRIGLSIFAESVSDSNAGGGYGSSGDADSRLYSLRLPAIYARRTNGSPITQFTVTSDSGISYSTAPEPGASSQAALACALLLMIHCSGRVRQRHNQEHNRS